MDDFFDQNLMSRMMAYSNGSSLISTNTISNRMINQNPPLPAWAKSMYGDGPWYVFERNKVHIFKDHHPLPSDFSYGTWMYDGDWWYRCSPVGPAPKAKEWFEKLDDKIPLKLKVKMLLLE